MRQPSSLYYSCKYTFCPTKHPIYATFVVLVSISIHGTDFCIVTACNVADRCQPSGSAAFHFMLDDTLKSLLS